VLATAVVLAVAVVNIAGARFIDRVQPAIVIVLLAVFAIFIVVTLGQVDPQLLAPSTYPPAVDLISSVALTFFAYLGFAVISFTGGDLTDPARNLPRAMYIALGITTVLYVLISIGVFGTLTVEEVIANGDTALAQAAKPALGEAGFVMMAIAALLATSSSVNANIYAATGSTAKLAESEMFPPVFGQLARVGGTRGLVISVIVVLLLANFVDLTAIASLGSAVALAIFLITSIAAYRLRAETGSRTSLLLAGILLTIVVLLVFLRNEPLTFVAIIGILAFAIVLDLVWSRIRARRIAAG
jgi:amino acid transporter